MALAQLLSGGVRLDAPAIAEPSRELHTPLAWHLARLPGRVLVIAPCDGAPAVVAYVAAAAAGATFVAMGSDSPEARVADMMRSLLRDGEGLLVRGGGS